MFFRMTILEAIPGTPRGATSIPSLRRWSSCSGFASGSATNWPEPPDDTDPETLDFGMGVTLVAAVLAVISTFYLPGPLIALIRAAATVVSGGI
jgi:hypothetical protein